jgi:hypothetical protein
MQQRHKIMPTLKKMWIRDRFSSYTCLIQHCFLQLRCRGATNARTVTRRLMGWPRWKHSLSGKVLFMNRFNILGRLAKGKGKIRIRTIDGELKAAESLGPRRIISSIHKRPRRKYGRHRSSALLEVLLGKKQLRDIFGRYNTRRRTQNFCVTMEERIVA